MQGYCRLPTESLDHPIERRARLLVENAINQHQWGVSSGEDAALYTCCEAINKLRQGKSLSPDEAAALYKKAFALLCEREAQAVKIVRSRKGTLGALLREAARFLRWPDDKYNSELIHTEYRNLTQGYLDFDTLEKVDAVSSEEAYEKLAKDHGLHSAEACKKRLARYQKKRKTTGL
jgi:hypothetical protein